MGLQAHGLQPVSFQTGQGLSQRRRYRGAVMGKGGQAASLVVVALSPIQRQPHRLQRLRVVRRAREQVPVQVRNLIAEQFVIQLVRPEALFDGTRQQTHLIEVSASAGVVQSAQLGGVIAGNEDAVAAIELPRPQQRHRMGELPDDVLRRQIIDRSQFAAEETLGEGHVW